MADGTAIKWFTDDFIQTEKEEVSEIISRFMDNSPAGYQSNCAMVRDADFRENLKEIDQPVLIVAGSGDPVTTADDARNMHSQIKNSQLVILNARHLSAFERPKEFNEAVLRFLGRG